MHEISNNYHIYLKYSIYLKCSDREVWANSADTDQMALNAASDQGWQIATHKHF